ncbi:SMI1/KNR4 family protein [Pedobacter sp. FW305-3-2-15-E-R2A2]|uniref:SMI1/KNR4 family protein n=1 Tax=Pedobacter sp. FW305-3-2-15-E-R2A2 TaxID=3140251 RepID=UPI003140157F
MMYKLLNFLRKIVKNDIGASEKSIQELQKQIAFELSQDYIQLMKNFNAGEGEIGENGWLCLFPVEDLVIANSDYKLLMEQIPDYFLFGKDAADTGYAFHK